MKLKKVMKILPEYERIRVWGKDEDRPLYDGEVGGLPKIIEDYKFIPGETGSYFDIRYDCSDIYNHVAIFVKEE